MKASGILVWDCSACPAKGTEFIQRMQKMTKITFAKIIVVSADPQAIPPAVSDLSISLPVITRFGPNATRDSLIDVIHHLSKSKNELSVFILSDSFPLWISLFQRVEPRSVVFVSGRDPRECLDFSFLPPSLSVTVLSWPNLDSVSSSAPAPREERVVRNPVSHKEPSVSNSSMGFVEEEEEIVEGSDEEVSDPRRGGGGGGGFSGTIQPLSNLDKYQIDLRSPVGGTPSRQSESGDITPKRGSVSTPGSGSGVGHDQSLEVPVKFRPLIEAMKSMGKAMISLSDLEGQLKTWSAKLNEPIDNINAYITKAADAQLVIYDKSINYVRFRNRSMANAAIEYV